MSLIGTSSRASYSNRRVRPAVYSYMGLEDPKIFPPYTFVAVLKSYSTMPPPQVLSHGHPSWTSSQDDKDSQLPDDDEFIAALLADNDDELSDQDMTLDSLYSDKQTIFFSPASVLDFAPNSSPAKRRKLLCVDLEDVHKLPLPLPVKRQSWNRPVCTFLNYLGSRKPERNMTTSTLSYPAIPQGDELKGVSTSEILFPVCPCKLRKVCYALGDNHTFLSPPMLQLLATTGVCNSIAHVPVNGQRDKMEEATQSGAHVNELDAESGDHDGGDSE